MKLKIVLLLLLSSYALRAQEPSPFRGDARLNGLDSTFQRILTTFHTAGFAVAVVKKDKVIYAKGFGYRNLEEKLPVTPNTLFSIGSCTKAFTASLIGLLQKEGKVNIDQPVSSFMPSLRFYNNDMNNAITLRDMMSHRTGLPRHDLSWLFFPTESRDSTLQRIQYQEPTAPVRTLFQYNNFMFAAQGAIAEKLTGKSWEENLREDFFVPLGMTATNTSIAELEKSREPATGYDVYRDTLIRKMGYFEPGGIGPAGAINSSVTDLAKWVITWINGGRFGNKEIIPAAYCLQAISSQMVVSSNLPTTREPGLFLSNYGLGWFLSAYKSHYRVEHGGNTNGFSASTCFFPADSIGIVVLSNQNNSSVPGVVRNLIADRLLGQPEDDWIAYYQKQDLEASTSEQKQLQALNAPHLQRPLTHSPSDYTGSYFNPGYGHFRISLRHDSLVAVGSLSYGWLRHYSYDIFDFFLHDKFHGLDTTALPFRLQFLMNAKGEIEGVSGVYEPGLKPIVFTKELEAVPLAAKDLPRYTGVYESNGMVIKVYTKEPGRLYVQVPGLPEYEMIRLGEERFGIKAVTGYYIQFRSDSTGKILHATFINPNGTFTATKR